MNDNELIEKKVLSREIFNGDIVHLFKDNIILPNGKGATREVIKHCGAVAIVPILEDGSVILERQFRYPINSVITEIPAGKTDCEGENIIDAARRELLEETGYEAGKLIPIGDLYTSPAFLTEVIHMFVATDLTFKGRHLDEDEFINIFTMPLCELCGKILSGEICDAKTQLSVLKAKMLIDSGSIKI